MDFNFPTFLFLSGVVTMLVYYIYFKFIKEKIYSKKRATYEAILQNFSPSEHQQIGLKHGLVNYSLRKIDNTNAPLIVFLHGISSSSFTWKHFASCFYDKAHLLLYDFYGRGLSESQPNLKFDQNVFVDQLYELLQALQLLNQPIYLIGHSLGAAVGSLFSLKFPELVQKLVLIAPAGFPTPAQLWISLSRFTPEWIYGLVLRIGLTNSQYALTPSVRNSDFELVKRIVEESRVNLFNPFFVEAHQSSVIHFPLSDMKDVYIRLSESNPSCDFLLIWGE